MNAELRGLVDTWHVRGNELAEQYGRLPDGDPAISILKMTVDTIDRCRSELEAALSVAQGQGWVPVSQQMPPDDLMVLVYWTEEGEDRYDFEATEEGVWIKHAEHYDNYLSVALPENSRGPSEQAPYTHWRTVEAPAAAAQPDGVGK